MTALTTVPELPRISDYLFHHAARHPERELAVLGDVRLTYREVAEHVRALSRALLERGVGAGDRVATLCTPRPEFLLAFLATVDIGAIWVGLSPKYQLGELRHVVQDSAPTLLLGMTEFRGRHYQDDLEALAAVDSVTGVVTIAGRLPGLEALEDLIDQGRALDDDCRQAARARSGGRHAAIVVYTSGTTGAPKGALLSHTSLAWSFVRQAQRWGIDPMRVICNLPINHSGCVGDTVSTCLTAGGTLVLMEQFDPDGMLELIPHERVNTLMQVPTQYQVLAGRPGFATADLSSLRAVTWGGAAMPRAVLDAFARPGLTTQVVYGQTESPASVTYSEPDATVEQLTTTIGRPDPEMEVRLARPDGSVCTPGETGEIQVHHRSVFLGYFRNPEATDTAFTEDGFLRTGDLAVERPDGYLELVGRLKEMFKSGGYNVYPREVELCLERHYDVLIAVVVGAPDPLWGEVGHAFVVLRSETAASPADLEAWCRSELANYKVPKTITVCDELPMLPIGKPDKQALKAIAREQAELTRATSRENVA